MVGSEAGRLSVNTNPIPLEDQQEMSGVTGWKQQPAGGPARRGALLPIYVECGARLLDTRVSILNHIFILFEMP